MLLQNALQILQIQVLYKYYSVYLNRLPNVKTLEKQWFKSQNIETFREAIVNSICIRNTTMLIVSETILKCRDHMIMSQLGYVSKLLLKKEKKMVPGFTLRSLDEIQFSHDVFVFEKTSRGEIYQKIITQVPIWSCDGDSAWK